MIFFYILYANFPICSYKSHRNLGVKMRTSTGHLQAQWDFLFLFFSFLRKSGKLQSNHTGPVLCLDMGKRISKLIPPNLSFQLNNFIVASDGEGEKQQPCHLPFSYHVLVTCHRLLGVKNCHGHYFR